MSDSKGAYVLDWPVKDKFDDFYCRGKGTRKREEKDDAQISPRILLQEAYFADAGVRCQRVAGGEINSEVRCNLADLFMDHTYPIQIEPERRSDMLRFFREAIGRDVPAHHVLLNASRKLNVSLRECSVVLKQGVWRRELRVDLFRPFLMDKPLRPEREDVLVHYRDLFRR